MKPALYLLIPACLLFTNCTKENAENDQPRIRVNQDYISLFPRMQLTVKVASDIDWGIMNNHWDIADADNYQKKEDGTETIDIRALKKGHAKIRLSEMKTDKYGVEIDVYCTAIAGAWVEKRHWSDSGDKYTVHVQAEPAVKEQIEQALLAEASARYGAEYNFGNNQTFTMRMTNGTEYAGTYEHTDNGELILHYNGITERYWLQQQNYYTGSYFIVCDEYEKFRKLYPGYEIIKAECRRHLSVVEIH